MTVETPTALDIRAVTHPGRGLSLPIAKTLAHLMLVNEACEAGWPITFAVARAEISEAASHLSDLHWGDGLVTEDLLMEIEAWIASVQDYSVTLSRAAAPEDDAPMTETNLTTLRTIITQTWALLTFIDREITGLPVGHTDPGNRP